MKIVAENLHKSYRLNNQEIPVLKGLSFTLPSGSLASLTGPSGVGKSTLLHILGTLDNPTSGDLFLQEQKVADLSSAELSAFRNLYIGFVFQFHHLLPEFTALENVVMPLSIRRLEHKKAQKRAQDILGWVGLGDRFAHKPGELSGGEQQRVALARALAQEPHLLLADEPTGNLDEKTGFEIIELILKTNRTHRVTTILVTHNQAISKVFPTQIALSKEGLSIRET